MTPKTMHLSLRSTLVAALVAAFLSGTALAQPVKVKLPKGAPETPREPPAELKVEDQKGLDRKSLKSKGRFMLDFEKVDIDKLVQTISDMTGKLFILPDNIRGKITIIGPEHGKIGVTADEAYAAFLSALDANGLTLYPAGKYMKIVEKRAGKQSNIPTMLEVGEPYTLNEQMMTKLFRLSYVEAEPVRAVIQQLVSRDGDTIAFPPDTIIVNDIGLNMHRLERIIERLDQPASSHEIRVVQIQYAAATDIAEKIRSVFEEKQRQPGQRSGAAIAGRRPTPAKPAPTSTGSTNAKSSEDPASLSQLIADERTNKLIIVANDKAFERIEVLLTHLDTPVPGEGQVHVYYLENANAEELASTLASLTQGINRPATPRPQPQAGGAKTPPTVADLFSGEMKITADKGTNSLVIVANNTDYRNLVKVIEQLDIARRQVFVEAVIMEVNLKNTNDFGISLHAGAPASLDGVAGDESVAVLGSQIGNSRSLSGILS
ncbi:MAG: secretin N-terminal domain-containing protein, partial [Myxococcales bacterium]